MNPKTLLLSLIFLCLNSFAYDAQKCMAASIDASALKQLSNKGAVLNELVSKISNQAAAENYYKNSDMLAPISMTASQTGLASVSMLFAKLNYSKSTEDAADVHKLLLSSLNIFLKNNELFLSDLNASIDSSTSVKIKNYLQEVRTTILEINYLLSSCRY